MTFRQQLSSILFLSAPWDYVRVAALPAAQLINPLQIHTTRGQRRKESQLALTATSRDLTLPIAYVRIDVDRDQLGIDHHHRCSIDYSYHVHNRS